MNDTDKRLELLREKLQPYKPFDFVICENCQTLSFTSVNRGAFHPTCRAELDRQGKAEEHGTITVAPPAKLVEAANYGEYCRRCGHCWIPRQSFIRVCPKCHSPYWEQERQPARS